MQDINPEQPIEAHILTPRPTRGGRSGLARVVSVPEPRDYLVAQFLGEAPATVPPVLNAQLRMK